MALELDHRTRTILLLGILLLGLSLRLLHFWAISQTAFPRIPFVFVESDSYAYWRWAQTILAGDWLGRDTYHPYFDWMRKIAPLATWHEWWGGKETFQQAPFYPYWLAALRAAFGNSPEAVILVQLVVGALQPLVMFLLARQIFDERMGLAAAALTALYGPFIFFQGTLLRDWISPILEPLALLFLLRGWASGRRKNWFIAGVLLGLALLVKETALVLPFLLVVWMGWENGRVWSKGLAAACLGAGFFLVLSPLVIRNGIVDAPLFALSNRSTESFIAANAVDSSPVGLLSSNKTRKTILERSGGKFIPAVRETIATYNGNYMAFFHKQFLKLRGLMDPYESPDNASFYYGLDISPVLGWTLRYGLIFPIGVAGFVVSLPAWRRQKLFYLYFAAVLAGLFFSMILARYRLMLVPVLIVYAAAFGVWLRDSMSAKLWARVLGGLAVVAVAAVVQQFWAPLKNSETYPRYQEYLFAASLYASEKKLERAAEELARYRQKLDEGETVSEVRRKILFATEGDYRASLAHRFMTEGRWDDARREIQLVSMLYAGHPRPSVASYNLGVLYFALNEPLKARVYLEQFLTMKTDGAQAERARRLLSMVTVVQVKNSPIGHGNTTKIR